MSDAGGLLTTIRMKGSKTLRLTEIITDFENRVPSPCCVKLFFFNLLRSWPLSQR